MNILQYKNEASFIEKVNEIKQYNKNNLAALIKEKYSIEIDSKSIFDIHVKRIHEYKRQVLNVLHIMYLYHKLLENPNLDIYPRTFIFAGKAAPGYYLAKEIIKLRIEHQEVLKIKKSKTTELLEVKCKRCKNRFNTIGKVHYHLSH